MRGRMRDGDEDLKRGGEAPRKQKDRAVLPVKGTARLEEPCSA
jgi:hypothetical protein